MFNLLSQKLTERYRPLAVCPLNGKRFFYWKRITYIAGWVSLFSVTVPSGMRAVINRIGALIDPNSSCYSVAVDGVIDPVCRDITWRLVSGVDWNYKLFWPHREYIGGGGPIWSIKGCLLIDPIEVSAGQTFGLYAIARWGSASFGIGGGLGGYFEFEKSQKGEVLEHECG